MIRDKAFLRDIYSGDNVLKNKRVLNGANDSEINTLIAYIHYTVNGDIKINKRTLKPYNPN